MKRVKAATLSVLVVATLTGVASLTGCPPSEMDLGNDDPDPSEAGADAGADKGCPPGICVRRPPLWDGPLWVWIGPDPAMVPLGWDGPPACPSNTDGDAGDWHADLLAPTECAACTCGPSTGSCALPSSLMAHDVVCQDLDQPHNDISFDPPASWDGACDNMTQIPANVAKSLTIAPLTVSEESCPIGPVDPRVPALTASVVPYIWQTFVRTCYGHGWSQCGSPLASCIPKGNQPASEFRLCVILTGEYPERCDGEWPEKHVIYKEVKDERQCLTECTCGPPVGSMCTAKASVYQNSDSTCDGATVEGDVGIASTGPKCFDIVPPGQPLGSKSATSPTYIAGTCEPILGTAIGSAAGQEPATLCCRTEPLP